MPIWISFDPLPSRHPKLWGRVAFRVFPAIALVSRIAWRLSGRGRTTGYDNSVLWRLLWHWNRRIGRLPREGEARTVARVGLGLRMDLNLARLTDCFAYVFGAGECDVEAAFRAFAGPRDAVLDIGANVGTATLAFARLRPKATIYAVEASALMRAELERNIALNALSNIQIVPFAAGDQPGRAFLRAETPENPGSAFISAPEGLRCTEGVEVVRLDDRFPEGVRVGFMKLDIEGYETRALRGARRILTRDKPVLVVEVNELALGRAGSSVRELLESISGMGYALYRLDHGRRTPVRAWDSSRLANLIAIHPGRRL